MFQFPGLAPRRLYIQRRVPGHDPGTVSRFRYLRINACLPASRSISQATTSFFASRCQDIHRTPLSSLATFIDHRLLRIFDFRLWICDSSAIGHRTSSRQGMPGTASSIPDLQSTTLALASIENRKSRIETQQCAYRQKRCSTDAIPRPPVLADRPPENPSGSLPYDSAIHLSKITAPRRPGQDARTAGARLPPEGGLVYRK